MTFSQNTKKLIDIFYFTSITSIFIDSFFYQGFTKKHFFIEAKHLAIFYIVLTIILFLLKKTTISSKLQKLNKYIFYLSVFSSITFLLLEQYTYPNFIYGHLHLNPYNLLNMVLFSGIIFYLYNYKKIKQHYFIYLPLVSYFICQIVLFNDLKTENLFDFNNIFNNFIIWFFIMLFFISLFNKKSLSIIYYLLFSFLFIITNNYKIKSWGQPVNIYDLYLLQDLKEFLVGFLSSGKILFQITISINLLFLIIILIKKISTSANPPLKIRLKLFIFSTIFIIYPIFFKENFAFIFKKIKTNETPTNAINFCKTNGTILYFYNNLQNIKTTPPKEYNQARIKEIYQRLKNSNQTQTQNQVKPNIVIILSESVFNVSQLPNIKISTNPIKNILQDQKATLISPQFGGGTANIEFEIITGFSNYFMQGKVPYNQSIHQKIPTIFSLFKESGYTTTTIHPYLRAMFNRAPVYKHFGVDKFISIENMSDYEKTGSYVSDKSFIREIIKQFNSTKEPQLIFALSMQNHFPFEKNRFKSNPIEITTKLNQEINDSLKTYINGIYFSDQSYLTLKEELIKSNKPTIIIIYGDHLPLIDENFGLYKKLGFVPENQSQWSKQDYLKMYSTPVSVWSNFKNSLDITPVLSPNFLSLEILKLANIPSNYQFKFLEYLKNTSTVLNQNLIPDFSPEQINDYQLVQYDLISGHQYILK